MNAAIPTAILSMAGQSIWVDNITRAMLRGTLQRYVAEWSVVGLTSNPTIFAKAIAGSSDYDAQVAELSARGMNEEEIFFALALVGLQLAWQVTTLDITDAKNCLFRFRSNRDVGIALFLGLAADTLLSWWSGFA